MMFYGCYLCGLNLNFNFDLIYDVYRFCGLLSNFNLIGDVFVPLWFAAFTYLRKVKTKLVKIVTSVFFCLTLIWFMMFYRCYLCGLLHSHI